MNYHANVPCPDCGQNIPIESTLLIQGANFKCPNEQCNIAISLDASSGAQVQQAYEQLDKLKNDSLKDANM